MNSSEQNAVKRCPECGAIMTEALPQELCPACMMRRGFTPSASEAAATAEDLAVTQTVDTSQSHKNSESSDSSFTSSSETGGGELVAGQSFGDYTIVRRLGRGGMGTVYEADHGPTGRRVALKVLAHSLDDPQARARFLREGRLAASINHPNSVYVYGTEQIGETPSISMELIHGGTLQQWVRAKGEMDVSAAVDAVLQIIDGLEAADRKGVLHRDVKPANCFIDQTGTIKIGDFGLSISTDARDDLTISNVTCAGTFLGTPAFASPEQLRGEPLDRRSDIYSVGVTLFYLLTGKTPFSGENMVQLLATVLDKQAPALRSIRPEIPEELDLLVQRCLQKSPGQRYSSYDALREALLPLSSMRPTPAPMGNRLIANIIDVAALSMTMMLITYGLQWFLYGGLAFIPRFGPEYAWFNVGITLVTLAIPLTYYALCEWRTGKTLGKHLLRLRVTSGDQRISFRQAAIRAAIFVVIPNIPSFVFSVMVRNMSFEMMQQSPVSWFGMLVGLGFYLLKIGLFSTARNRNGYAGIHELASGTRVVCKLSLRPRPTQSKADETFDSGTSGDKIGPYHVLQPLWGSGSDRLVLAYDTKLLRRVWVRVQPPGSPEVDATSRNLARITRLRWLGARRTDSQCWDCYEAPEGKPFTRAIDEGLCWEAIVGALRQLSHELRTACSEASPSDDVSLAHLWLTEEESLKLLPFTMQDQLHQEQTSDSRNSDSLGPQNELRLLREAARYSFQAIAQTESGQPQRGASLSAHESLARVCQAATLEQASQQLDALATEPTVNVRLRTAGLLAVSLSVPAMLILSSLVASLALQEQKSQMPRVTELSKVTMLLDIEGRSHHPEKDQRVAALQTYISATYRDVIEDEVKMKSLYATIVIPYSRRDLWLEVMAEPLPSVDETAAAKKIYEDMISEPRAITPAEMGFFSMQGFAFVATFAWMEIIWIPSLVTAIACRGGVLLWMFGLTLVNRRGQRASRLRVFVRMLIGGVPALAIVFAFMRLQLLGGFTQVQLTVTIIVIVICISAFIILGRQRLLHDRLAGTYLVPR